MLFSILKKIFDCFNFCVSYKQNELMFGIMTTAESKLISLSLPIL